MKENEKLEIQRKELKYVSGGTGDMDDNGIQCKKCKKYYKKSEATGKEKRKSGCGKAWFFQCPRCGEWNCG